MGGVGGEGGGGWAWTGARKTLPFMAGALWAVWAVRSAGHWASTEARKTLLFMAGH